MNDMDWITPFTCFSLHGFHRTLCPCKQESYFNVAIHVRYLGLRVFDTPNSHGLLTTMKYEHVFVFPLCYELRFSFCMLLYSSSASSSSLFFIFWFLFLF